MKNKEIHTEDKLIKDFFDSYSTAAPSDEFTKHTMNSVLHEWSIQPISTNTKLSIKNRVWIAASMVLAVFLIYYFDIKHANDETSIYAMSNFGVMKESFQQLLGSSYAAFSRVPKLIYIITFGLSTLLLIDKMVQRRVSDS